MKRLLYIITGVILLSGCAVSNDARTARLEKRMNDKVAESAIVKKAVESRQYIIKMDKIYGERGTWADLTPRNNYLIIDGEIASVSLGYIGRSYKSGLISGINFNGHTVAYKLNSDETKGLYKIETSVRKGNDTFDFFLTISADGSCMVNVNNIYIQSVSYKGSLVPITRLSKNQISTGARM